MLACRHSHDLRTNLCTTQQVRQLHLPSAHLVHVAGPGCLDGRSQGRKVGLAMWSRHATPCKCLLAASLAVRLDGCSRHTEHKCIVEVPAQLPGLMLQVRRDGSCTRVAHAWMLAHAQLYWAMGFQRAG